MLQDSQLGCLNLRRDFALQVLNSVVTIKGYEDFSSWTEYILHYEMAVCLWGHCVEGFAFKVMFRGQFNYR